MTRKSLLMLLASLVPSWFSLLVSFGLGLIILIGHVLILSTASGLLLPNLLPNDSELWGNVLVSWVAPVVQLLTENQLVATLTIAIFWAIMGALAYNTIASTIAEAHNRQDPTMRFYLQLLGWHMFVGAAFVGVTLLLAPLIRWIFVQDELIAQSSTIAELLSLAVGVILSWIGILHAYVVLHRLYRRFYVS